MTTLPWSEFDERDDVGALVCMRVDNPRAVVVAGSTHGTCEECGDAVHVAPASRDLLAAPPDGVRLVVVCMPCAATHAQEFAASPTAAHGARRERSGGAPLANRAPRWVKRSRLSQSPSLKGQHAQRWIPTQ